MLLVSTVVVLCSEKQPSEVGEWSVRGRIRERFRKNHQSPPKACLRGGLFSFEDVVPLGDSNARHAVQEYIACDISPDQSCDRASLG